MRHQVAHRRLNRTSEHLQALLANLVTALIQHEQIRTTLPKAKEARRVAERLITAAKAGDLHTRRNVARTVRDPEALKKLFATLGPRFLNRPGGYTRIVKLGRRLGDAAPMALLELVERTPKAALGSEAGTAETRDEKAGLEKSAARPAARSATGAKPRRSTRATKATPLNEDSGNETPGSETPGNKTKE